MLKKQKQKNHGLQQNNSIRKTESQYLTLKSTPEKPSNLLKPKF